MHHCADRTDLGLAGPQGLDHTPSEIVGAGLDQCSPGLVISGQPPGRFLIGERIEQADRPSVRRATSQLSSA